MVAKVIKPTQDAFTLALKAQTGIITVKDFKFNEKSKVDYFIPEGNIVIVVENGSCSKGDTVIHTTSENLLSIKLFEKIIAACI